MIARPQAAAVLCLLGLTGCAVSKQYVCNAEVEGMTGDECPTEKCHLVSERYAHKSVSGEVLLGEINGIFLAKIEKSDPLAFSSNGRMAGIAYHESRIISDSDAPGTIGRLGSTLSIFTLGIVPFIKTVETRQMVDVIREDGESETFILWSRDKTHYSLLRFNLLFPYSDTDPKGFCVADNSWGMDYDLPMDDCRAKAYAKGVRLALAKMESRSNSSVSSKVTERIKEDAVGRMREKELRAMRDSGVISEEEYSREVKRLKSGGRGKEENK